MLLIAIDGMVLIFALPEIAADLEPSGAEQLWLLDIYALMLAGLLVTMSSLGDRFGRRRALLIGAFFFAAASVAGAMSTEPWMLIAARALLGVAGAAIMPGTLSLIRNMFLDRDQRSTAMAVWSAAGALGAAAGPIVGGWIIETFSWHAAFLMNIPVMVLLLVLAAGAALVALVKRFPASVLVSIGVLVTAGGRHAARPDPRDQALAERRRPVPRRPRGRCGDDPHQ
ncbi:MFS transporter [Arachnia propionica]|uniref:MFS transporter n=1 Tax=Arachnia propionica TaxID=1750 RepID=A0A3P1T4B6_9ACTN|nr:MFS transporter [Arachnia propionica]RRD04138.1 MFS transporter [Arachnia propionica]